MLNMRRVVVAIVVVSVLSQILGSPEVGFKVEPTSKYEGGDLDMIGYLELRNNYSYELLQQQQQKQEQQSFPQQNNITIWKKLDKQIQELLPLIKPSAEERERMEKSFRIVEEIVTRNFPGSRCYVFGSVGYDLWVREQSDLDIGTEMPQKNFDHEYQEQFVQVIGELLEKYNMEDIEAVLHARVPACRFKIPVTGIQIDISVHNNQVPYCNTQLLKLYSMLDPHIKDLIYIVKYWAKQRNINDTRKHTLSSISYAVLVIHFMQQTNGIPNLQHGKSENFGDQKCDDYFKQNVAQIKRSTEDKLFLGQLVQQFFEYYDNFLKDNVSKYTISIRQESGLISKADRWDMGDKRRHIFSIEDPMKDFDMGGYISDETFPLIKQEFKRANRILQQEFEDISNLFTPRTIEET